ncbi:DNA polymerase domain-containing protein [Halorubrum salinum]|uniref:DNA polymerase domain-containing protein n=1 Tax=Halorubrum salinum TaxID=767517 RepID=UPI002111EE4D|nr:DNA polymerase domain-containing protein [Halorubrum salinum]
MTQSGLSDFSSSDVTDDGSGGGAADRDDLAAEEAAVVAGGGRGRVSDVVDVDEAKFPDSTGTVELMITQIDYAVEGYGSDEYPVVHVFGRRPADRVDADHDVVEHVRVLGVEPYFYVPTTDLDRDPVEEYDVVIGTREEDADGETYESIRGEPLTRIVTRTPRDVGNIRDDFATTFEADILFPNRFLIDNGLNGGIRVEERRLDDEEGTIQVHEGMLEPAEVDADLRVNTFDIEVDDRRGFPEDGEEPIICLTSHDSYDDEYVVWLYDAPEAEIPPPDDLPGYEGIVGDESADLEFTVRTFEEEAAMLDAFVAYIDDTDPDLLTGWNFEDFDAPYVLDRLEVLDDGSQYDLSVDRLSRIGEVWRSGWGGPDIKGRVVFDLLYAYKRTMFTELESYRLDAVGERELGVGKERYTGDIGDLWEQDPERLLEYSIRDVELCVEIDRAQDVIAFWDDARKIVGCKLEDATTPGDAVDMYVLHMAYGNFALPSKGQQEAEEFEGGAVFDPISGVREMVSVLDLKSLYPMSMVTINASPETKVDPGEYDGDTYQTPTGVHFRKEPDGIIREMVNELLDEREEKKALRNEHDPGTEAYEQYDRQQGAVKVLMNSLYGVFGWDRFRLYDREMSAGVTSTNREVIDFTSDVTEELDREVTYGDSVTGDRPVVVRDPEGIVRILPIEDLFDRADRDATAEVLVTADGGPVASSVFGKDRRRLPGWEALSLSSDGKPEWKPIEQAIRHETDKPVVSLQHKFGESTTTRDHSYVVDDGDEFVETAPEDVKEPVRIPGFPNVDTIDTIDVYEVLNGYAREYEDGRSVGSENARSKTKRIHADDQWVWFGHEHHDAIEKAIKVRRYIDLRSEEGRSLVRLLAAYVTEGSASTIETTDSKFGASIAESREEWLEGLREDYHRLFEGATASVIASDTAAERRVAYETGDGEQSVTYDDTTCKLQMMNELSAVFFREFAGQTSRGKRVPGFVFSLPDELQQLFVDVLVEGDGSREFPRYSKEYAERNFDFETTSRELAAGLSMLLTQRERKHSLKYRDAKDSYTIRTCDFYRRGRDPVVKEVDHDGYVYDLSVADNENFVDGVGGVVLHNTDSVMLSLGDLSKERAIETSFEIADHINERYDDFAREELNADSHRFEIEFEKLYRRFFQAGKKKRYAGHIVWKEGKDVDDIDITGFEYKRSDIAGITKEVQQNVIETIVTGDDIDEDMEEVKAYLVDVIARVLDGDVDLEEIGIPGGIGKKLDAYETPTAQVRGAKYANLMLGTNFGSGSKPKRLYVEKVHPDFWARMEDERGLDPQRDPLYGEFKRDPDVICFEYADQVPEEFEVDWEKMLDKTLKGPIERVIEALGMSWEEVKTGQEQTGLGSFM